MRVCSSVLLFSLLATGSLFSAAPPKATGTIEGIVRFTGTVPPPRKLPTSDGTLLHHDLIVDKKTKGVRDVVAALADAPAQPKATKLEPVYVDQRDLIFIPHVIAVQHGQTVRFDNNDLCNHSVHAMSTVEANNFNVFVPQGRPVDQVFEVQKHPIKLGCSLHAWMHAWVYVFTHPWFAVSDAKGTFQIKNVPPGKYTLWLRHADTGLQDKRTVVVKAGQTVRVEVEWKKVKAD